MPQGQDEAKDKKFASHSQEEKDKGYDQKSPRFKTPQFGGPESKKESLAENGRISSMELDSKPTSTGTDNDGKGNDISE